MHTPVIPTEGCAEPKNHRNENRLVSVFLACSSSIYCLPWSQHCVSIEDGTVNKLENIHGLMQPSKEMNHSKCLTASEYLLPANKGWPSRPRNLLYSDYTPCSCLPFPDTYFLPGKPSIISHLLYIQNLHVWSAQSSTIECPFPALQTPKIPVWAQSCNLKLVCLSPCIFPLYPEHWSEILFKG